MLAHIAAWHDATAYRLHRFGATGHAQPKVVDDDEAFNARVAAEIAGRPPEMIRTDVHGSFERLRAAVLALDPELDPKGWVEAVVAGNTYEHYDEHRAELEFGVQRGGVMSADQRSARFRAAIQPTPGGGSYVAVPDAARDALGAGGRTSVTGTIDGFAIVGQVMPYSFPDVGKGRPARDHEGHSGGDRQGHRRRGRGRAGPRRRLAIGHLRDAARAAGRPRGGFVGESSLRPARAVAPSRVRPARGGGQAGRNP